MKINVNWLLKAFPLFGLSTFACKWMGMIFSSFEICINVECSLLYIGQSTKPFWSKKLKETSHIHEKLKWNIWANTYVKYIFLTLWRINLNVLVVKGYNGYNISIQCAQEVNIDLFYLPWWYLNIVKTTFCEYIISFG